VDSVAAACDKTFCVTFLTDYSTAVEIFKANWLHVDTVPWWPQLQNS